MKKRQLFSRLLLSAFAVPLNTPDSWQILKYKNLPANEVHFSDKGMKIKVQSSASPIIYPLPKKMHISSVTVEATSQGTVTLPKEKVQGEKGADDYPLRIGLVVSGNKTLSGPKSWLAPAWIKKLFSLAPKGEGIDHIYFLNVTNQENQLGRVREHPLSDLIKEEVVKMADPSGKMSFQHSLKEPLLAGAIWLSVDGDDTQSSFTVEISELKLSSESAP